MQLQRDVRRGRAAPGLHDDAGDECRVPDQTIRLSRRRVVEGSQLVLGGFEAQGLLGARRHEAELARCTDAYGIAGNVAPEAVAAPRDLRASVPWSVIYAGTWSAAVEVETEGQAVAAGIR